MKKNGILFIALVLLLLNSCKEKEAVEPDNNKEIRQFVYDNTRLWYLWEKYIPSNIDINNYTNPEDLFDDMIYYQLDHWSFITDDYQEFLNSLKGIEKMPGYKIRIFTQAASDNVFGMIEYVYANSPAAQAGLKRGNVIIKADGQQLTKTNYIEMLSKETVLLGLGKIEGNQAIDLGTSVSVTAIEMAINPVLQYKVIDSGGKKIGYLLYDQFIQEYFTDLQTVISYFKSQQINALILDLRYNPGGYISTCSSLASMIAPSTALDNVFINYQWNDILTDYFTKSYGASSDYFIYKFPKTTINLNLSKLYVLTSNRSASASELIINSLKPYMHITIIGDTTVGKYTGGIPIYDEKSTTNTYCLYLMVNKTANANGVTDFVNGFAPDFLVQDDYTTPLGEPNEPLLRKAIELITGIPAKKSLEKFEFNPYDKLFKNRFEKNGLMIYDWKVCR